MEYDLCLVHFYVFKSDYIPTLPDLCISARTCTVAQTHCITAQEHEIVSYYIKSLPAGNFVFRKFQIFPLWSYLNTLVFFFLILINSVRNWEERVAVTSKET